MSLPVDRVRYHVDAQEPPSERPQQRWVRVTHDGCPECLGRYNEPYVLMADLRQEWMNAGYECRHCGHVWWTGWGLELEVSA